MLAMQAQRLTVTVGDIRGGTLTDGKLQIPSQVVFHLSIGLFGKLKRLLI